MKFYYIKRVGNGDDTIAIPENHLEMTMKNHPEWIVQPDEEEKKEVVESKIVCPLCDKEFKSEHGLKIHKASHK